MFVFVVVLSVFVCVGVLGVFDGLGCLVRVVFGVLCLWCMLACLVFLVCVLFDGWCCWCLV